MKGGKEEELKNEEREGRGRKEGEMGNREKEGERGARERGFICINQ